MFRWSKKLHICSGLLSYAAFTVCGVVGIWASFLPSGEERGPGVAEVRLLDCPVQGNEADQQLADRMAEASGLAFAKPVQRPRRDDEGHLAVRYYTPNGMRPLLLLEDQRQLRIEQTRSSLGEFVNTMHMQTVGRVRRLRVARDPTGAALGCPDALRWVAASDGRTEAMRKDVIRLRRENPRMSVRTPVVSGG